MTWYPVRSMQRLLARCVQRRSPICSTHHQRRGVTLSEVLVSTLVMSIGVVALATLFPISVLRSIQASQLTNSANLRYNAEAQIRAVPELINIGTEWQPRTNYAQNDMVIPTAQFRRANLPAVYVCTTAGQSGGAEPSWNPREAAATTDDVAEWSTVTLRNYVIDPLGYMLVDQADTDGDFRGGVAGARQHFGNIAGTPFLPRLNRFPAFGLFNPSDTPAWNEYRAASVSVLPDTWTTQVESLELSNLTATSIELADVDFNVLSSSVQMAVSPAPDLVPDRLILMDHTGRRSHSLTITGITNGATGTELSWPSVESVPTGFTPIRARVESLERRYSYMLSVRRSFGGAAHVDVVIFFRRANSVQDEQVYSCLFRKIDRGPDGEPGVASTDDNDDGTDDDDGELGWTGSDDKPRNFCILQYSSTGLKPFFKKGGYVCDPVNMRWYRIIDTAESLPFLTAAAGIASVTPAGFEVDPLADGCDRFVRLSLDRELVTNSLDTTTAAGVDTLGGAILMRGIVDVFPLRPRTY